MSNSVNSPATVIPTVTASILGYRQLSPTEQNHINTIKRKGLELKTLIDNVSALPGIDPRAVAIARTEMQTGMMWLIRAIAQPEGF